MCETNSVIVSLHKHGICPMYDPDQREVVKLARQS